MAVKRFYAADMHTALNSIRTQLGADAVILATRQLSDGVEVSAAAGTDEGLGAITEPATASTKRAAETATAGRNNKSTDNNAWYLNSISALEDEQSALHSELGSIRSLLQCWMDKQSWESLATQSPVHAKLWERFRALGLEGEQINQLLKTVSRDQDLKSAWQLTLTQLRRQIDVLPNDLVDSGGIFAFLGATGVGKTTTIGKLATRYVLKHGADSVALVTTDRYRIAAHEQLRTLGKILGVTVQTVDSGDTLVPVLESLRSKQLVLIDTAGLNADHRNFNEQLNLLKSARGVLQSVLVLAATSQLEVQRAELNAYATLGLVAGIITKTDEAVSLGGSLGLLMANKMPVAYEAFGQSIPEDLSTANAQQLINKAVLISRHKPINEEQMVAGFNAAFTNTDHRESALSV